MRSSRQFACLTFVCFVLVATTSLGQTTQGLRSAPSAALPEDVVRRLQAHVAPNFDPLSDALEHHLQDSADLVFPEARTAARGAARTQVEDEDSAAASMSAKLAELRALRDAARERLGRLRDQLDRAGTGTERILAWKYRSDLIEARFARLEAAYQALAEAAPGPARSARLQAIRPLLQAGLLDRRANEVAPSAIPSPTTLPKPLMVPRASVTKPSRKRPAYANEAAPADNVYAFNGSTVLLAAADPTQPEAQQCEYSAPDLGADGQEIKFTAEINDLAARLDHAPVRIYQWVYDNIAFEPYYGSLKGAEGTLLTRAGNATDQASLLIALLRASNVPARYVRGRIAAYDLAPSDNANSRVQRWLGTANYLASSQVLANASLGGPFTINSTVQGVGLDHVWVEACVPYTNYRGIRGDNTGHRWIPLDTSVKDRDYRAGIAVNVPFPYSSFLSARTDRLPLERYEDEIETAVRATPNRSLEDVPPRHPIKPRRVDVLPASLPYEVVSFQNWSNTGLPDTAAVPDAHRYKFTATVQTTARATLLSATLTFPDAALKRLSLSYTPDAASQALWNSWGGALNALPAGSVRVFPAIKLEGSAVGSASGTFGLGDTHWLIMRMSNAELTGGQCVDDNGGGPVADPTCVNKAVYGNLKAGGYHALQGYAQQGADALLAQRAGKLVDGVRANPTPPTPAQPAAYDATVGEFLHYQVLRYARGCNDADARTAALSGFVSVPTFDVGLTSSDMKVNYLFDVPFSVSVGGVSIDYKGGQYSFVKSDTTATTLAARVAEVFPLAKMSIYNGSALEHLIWQEQLRTDAVSTVRGLQWASENSIALVTLNAANIASYDALMDASMQPYKAQIQAYIAQGGNAGVVTAPRATIAYSGPGQPQSWRGAVYMAENPVTGSFGALIAGNLSGGYPLLNPTPSTSIFTSNPISPFSFGTSPNPIVVASANPNGANGRTANTSWFGDPVNVLTGNFFHSERDFFIKGRAGFPVVFERWYNSGAPKSGPLGFGWTHSFHHYLSFYGVEGGAAKVSWTDGTGAERFFSTTSHTGGNVGAGATLANSPGVFVAFTRLNDGTGRYQIRERDGLTYLFESVTATATDTGQRARLLSITDRNANSITLTYTGNNLTQVRDAVGAGRTVLTLAYDANNRIDSITDLSGRQYRYRYTDGNGNLNEVHNPLFIAGQQANPIRYAYYGAADGTNLNHLLRTHRKPRGNGMQFEYYGNAQVFRHTALDLSGTAIAGQSVTFYYNVFRRETRTLNERGHERQFFFDAFGNVVKLIEENGAEHNYAFGDATRPTLRTSTTGPSGYVTQYAYTADSYLSQVTNVARATSVTMDDYTAFGAPRRLRDARGHWSVNNYDARGNLTDEIALRRGITPPATIPSNYAPAAADVIARRIHTYDGFGNLTATRRVRDFSTLVGPALEYAFDANGLNLLTLTRRGDQDGTPATLETDVSPAFTYDTLGRLKTGIDARWYAISLDYDALDRVILATDALGKPRSTRFDDNDNPLGEQLVVAGQRLDSNAASYDALDRPTRRLDAGGHLTQFDYDAAGNLIRRVGPDNDALGFDYDPADRVASAFDEERHRVVTVRDIEGRPNVVIDPNGNSVTMNYWGAEREGRLQRVQQPAIPGFLTGQASEFDYDDNGNATVVTQVPMGGGSGRVSRRFHDELNRPVRLVGPPFNLDGTGARPLTCLIYNTLGYLTETWAGQTTDVSSDRCSGAELSTLIRQERREPDDFGRLSTRTDALGRSWRQQYDVQSNLTRFTDAKGQVSDLTYDPGAYGQVRTRNNASERVTYTYDGRGHLASAETRRAADNALVVRTLYGYERANRLARVTDARPGRADRTLTYTWSPGGRLARLTDSEGNVLDYRYDAVGRLAQILAPNYDALLFAYDAGGRLTARWASPGAGNLSGASFAASYAYHPDDRLASLVNRSATGAAELSSHVYGYDAWGNRATQAETINGATINYSYGYDGLDRLTRVDNTTPAQQENYSYDPWGNRRTRSLGDPVASTLAYGYDAANQLATLRSGSEAGPLAGAWVHDANGSLVKRCSGSGLGLTPPAGGAGTTALTDCAGSSNASFGFDALNRMVSANVPGAPVQSYTYDEQGRRIGVTSAGSTTQFLYDGADLHAQYGATGTLQALYVHAGTDAPLLRLAPNGVSPTSSPEAQASYYHADALGSLVATTDNLTATFATQRFDAWGNRIAQSGSIPVFGYTGREPDATGLVFYRARYYDPSIGRFTARDPLGLDGGLNAYVYVENNPLLYVDPMGTLPTLTDAGRVIGSYWGQAGQWAGEVSLGTRVTGGLRAVGGAAQSFLGGSVVVAGAGPSATGVGSLVGVPAIGLGSLAAAHGADHFQTGLRQLWTGRELDTVTSRGLQAAGLSQGTANLIDAGAGIALSAGAGFAAQSAAKGTTPLFQAVGPAEFADIKATGALRNLGSAEGTYFTTSAAEASAYAKQAVKAFGDQPYTIIRTDVPNSIFKGLSPATVYRGIPAWVIPTDRLPGLAPSVMNRSPLPPVGF